MKKIILIEDEPSLVDIYRQAFSKVDFDIEIASNKEQMLEELRQIRNGVSQKPDLVILDMILPDGNGIDILKAMKKSLFTRDIPVFTFTNYQNPDLEGMMAREGIVPEKSLIKVDYTPHELMDTVRRYLS